MALQEVDVALAVEAPPGNSPQKRKRTTKMMELEAAVDMIQREYQDRGAIRGAEAHIVTTSTRMAIMNGGVAWSRISAVSAHTLAVSSAVATSSTPADALLMGISASDLDFRLSQEQDPEPSSKKHKTLSAASARRLPCPQKIPRRWCILNTGQNP